MKVAPWFVLVLALVAGAARAAAAPQMSPVDLEREARSLEAALIAPCCFSQQVSVHESPASDEVRRDVRARLAAGQTRQQILDAYVKEYGKRILAVPPPEGFDVTLYVTPIAVFVLTAVLGVVAVRRFTRHSAPSEPAPADGAAAPGRPDSASDEERLDEELRDMD